MSVLNNSEMKCVSVNLSLQSLNKVNSYKEKIGKSQNSTLIELIEKGLSTLNPDQNEKKSYFFVKVRIDTSKMMEMGKKLQNGELDTSNIVMTYCIKDDPAVGLNIWQTKDQKCFEEIFAQHKIFYSEVMEIIPVTTPAEAMKLIIEKSTILPS